ncbi:carboxypeptidase regulatory-like domain-containing protein [Nocardioides hwasunensis]|uniref:Carboxypeptidase regulatory-like domain-containing protein n=1 Tax=Nocardioides hwasunensis TaxID=397258 RepID=A0ABR8ME75_9ACTN|nr:carboxypeptidase regulatory-like domain-containing protein [Nocardioides hwasunensis]MBD3914411.1 carboxypeptidase regulatory-like domain-containing protein [Nocardioides hwasunensis]
MSRRAALLAITALLVAMVAAPALALADRWAAWGPIQGSSNAFRTTMTQQPGFPAATVTSDSRSPVSLPAGASTFLGASTPPGQKYGSSAGNAYLLLRPKADTATTPSTTTYTFDSPTPDIGWAFVLGDIDSDAVRVSATDASGGAVPAATIASWWRGAFNYAGGTDVPTFDAADATLTGNATAADTDGASGWFEPTTRLTSLTFTFTRRAGFPVYQTWFVSRARPIGGTVSSPPGNACSPAQATLTLVSPFGEPLATTQPAADGTYSFGQFATQAGYVVRISVPDTCAIVGAAQKPADNRGNDNSPASRADFAIREIIPQPISGRVVEGDPTDAAAPGVAGVVVTLTPPGGGPTRSTTTDADGSYLFDFNDDTDAAGYTVSIAVPTGYVAGPQGTSIGGLVIQGQPFENQNFGIVALPSVSGTVTGGGVGIGGVQVVLTPTTGPPITIATRGDGTYELTAVPPGDYTLSVVAPDGFTAPPPRPITVSPAGLTGQDVALERPGAVGGTITRDGSPVAGVEVVVEGPGGPQAVRTDADGHYFLDQLGPGTWTVTVRAPDGTVVVGAASQTATITAAGEIRGGLDFVLAATPTTPPPTTPTGPPTATPSPTQTPTPTPTPTDEPTDEPTESPSDEPTVAPTSTNGGDDGGGGVLPDTGGPSVWLGATSAAAVLAGLVLVALSRRRPRRP